jgi:hypothetical protein
MDLRERMADASMKENSGLEVPSFSFIDFE